MTQILDPPLSSLSDIKFPYIDENKLFGKLNDSRSIYPVSVRLSCNHGYWAHPDTVTLKCLPTGQWSPSPEPCQVITCPVPPIPKFASISSQQVQINGSTHFLSVIELVCDWQHKMVQFVNRSVSTKTNVFHSKCSRPKEISDRPIGEWIPPPSHCICVGPKSSAGLCA